jgi:hypothetical protein
MQETRQTRFTFVPQVGGLHRVTVQALPERFTPDGPVPSMSQYLHVTDELIRVLYLEGKPRHEGTFILRALAASDQIRLQKAVLAVPKEDGLHTVPGGPTGEWQWYHVIILGDMAPGQLSGDRMQSIRDHVGDHGCGLAILGSRGMVGKAALVGTPLGELLPFDASVGWMDDAVTVTPTPAGLQHPVCKIDESLERLKERWASLPAMRGACRFGDAKPAAQILATNRADEPLLVAHTYGAGRVLALAFDSTWQWCMLLDNGADVHRRFWRQVVLWLANRRPVVWIAADRPRYQLPLLRDGRQRVEIRAGVDQPVTGEVMDDVDVRARIVMPDGQTQPLRMTAGEDHYIAAADPKVDGTYTLALTVTSSGREVGRGAGQFVVESPDLEMTRQLADFDLLRAMAARTHPAGGKFATLDGLSEILKQIGRHDYRRRREEITSRALTEDGRWNLWLIFCGLLVVEWTVRKRRGLV